LKSDSRKLLMKKIDELHFKVLRCHPTNLDRVLKQVGLVQFFPFRRGRTPKK